jgi:hypothetical protein
VPEASVLREALALGVSIGLAALAFIGAAINPLPTMDLSHTISSADATNDMLL